MPEFALTTLLPSDITLSAAIVLIGVSFLTSAISATFGLGGGVAMLIAMLSFTPPIIALPLHAMIQIGSNTGRAWMVRAHVMPDIVRWFIPGALLGIFLASFIFVSLPVQWLQLMLASFILWSVWAPKIRSRQIAFPAYLGVGAFSSFATMFLGSTGPMLAAFLSPDRYGRDRTVATHATCMAIQHLIKVIAFGFLGFVITEWITLLAMMIISGLLGTWFGGGLLRRFPEPAFRTVFKFVLSALALRLVYTALMAET